MNENLNYSIRRGSPSELPFNSVYEEKEIKEGVFSNVPLDLSKSKFRGISCAALSIGAQLKAGVKLQTMSPRTRDDLDFVDEVRSIPVPEGAVVSKNQSKQTKD